MTINHSPINLEHLTHPKYRADIDGLRAISILSVVVFHAFPSWLKGGFIGVDIFFVISGFLISTIMFGSLERNSFSFVEFYIRRINRIFPALLLVLISCFAFGWFALLADEYKQLGKHMAGGAGFLSNFILWNESGYFDNASDTKPLLHLWSLGVEEQFYIIWPLLLWLSWKQRLNLLTIALVVCIISFLANMAYVHIDTVAAFYSPQSRFWELMAGSILAYMTRHNQDIFPKFKRRIDMWLCETVHARAPVANGKILRDVQSMLGSVLIIIGILVTTKERQFPGWWALLPILGAVLIISAGAQAWVNRVVLSNRVMVGLGLISFPLYLWHWPVLSFARILESETPSNEIRIGAILISIVLAWFTYRFLESPFRFCKYGQLKTIVLFFLMVVVGCAGYNTYKREGLKHRQVVLNNIDPNQQITMQSNLPSRCTNEKKYIFASKFCTKYSDEKQQKTIVLWGDSSTGAWLPVFLDIAKSKHYTIINITHPSCPPILEARKTSFGFPESKSYCADGKLQEQVIDLIKVLKPNLIVMIGAWNFYSPYSNREYLTDNNYEEANSISTMRTIRKHIPETIKELEAINKLLIFKSWPVLPISPNYEISRIRFLQGESKRTVVNLLEFNKDSEYINTIFESVSTSNTVFFEPSKIICSDKCESLFNRTMMYHDAYHLTPLGSMQFKSEIEKLIE